MGWLWLTGIWLNTGAKFYWSQQTVADITTDLCLSFETIPQICWRKHIRLRVMGWHSVVWWLPKLVTVSAAWCGMGPSWGPLPTWVHPRHPSNEQVGVHVDVRNTNWEDHPKTIPLTVYIPFVSWLTTLTLFPPSYILRPHYHHYPGPTRQCTRSHAEDSETWSGWLLCFPGLWRQLARNPRGMVEMRMSQNLQERNPMIYHSLSCYRGSTTMHHHFLDLVCTDSMLAGPPAGRLLNLRDGDSNPNFDQ